MRTIVANILEWIRLQFAKESYRLSKQFERDLDGLSKSNPKLSFDLETFFDEFEREKANARRMPRCKGAYKIRMGRSGQGKSGGYRVVYFVRLAKTVWFLTIYAKNEQATLSSKDEKDLRRMIEQIKRGEEV